MKKRYIALAFVILLLTATSLALAEGLQHVSDLANRLTAQQKASLQQQAAELYQKSGFDVVFHTTNDSQNKGPRDYSFDYFHAFHDAIRYPDGAMIAVMYDTRDYYEAARGKGISLLTHRENNDLASVVQGKLTQGDLYGAFNNYMRYVRRLVIKPTALERTVEVLPYIAIAGLVAGLAYAMVLLKNLKIAKFKQDAGLYVNQRSLNLTESEDIFLFQNVTRTRIQTNSGSSGSSGGGFSSGSRGGTSYGGRGGKF